MNYVPVTSDGAVSGTVFHGLAFAETASAAARVTVHDGTDNTGPIMFDAAIAADSHVVLGGLNVQANTDAIFVDVTGTVSGAVYTS